MHILDIRQSTNKAVGLSDSCRYDVNEAAYILGCDILEDTAQL